MIMGHVGDTAFCPGKIPISPGHVGDTAFLPGQKTLITTFGALGGVAFDCSVLFSKHVIRVTSHQPPSCQIETMSLGQEETSSQFRQFRREMGKRTMQSLADRLIELVRKTNI